MIFKVHMLAFNETRGVVREVEVPDAEYVEADGIDNQILELVFKWGQNDFQPKKCYSVSAGDVVELDESTYYMAKALGWKKLSIKEFQSLEAPTACLAFS